MNATKRNEEIEKQIELAKNALEKYSYNIVAYIVESKLSKNARKTFFGFFFSGDEIDVGSVINNQDGSFSTVVGFVRP